MHRLLVCQAAFLFTRHCHWDAGEEAASMEKALGIRVVRHITKKPAGDAVDLEKHFRYWCLSGLAQANNMQAALFVSCDIDRKEMYVWMCWT